MSTSPKFTWGDSVVVVESDEVGSVCGLTEREHGIFYTVEFPDGSDRLVAEESVTALSDRGT